MILMPFFWMLWKHKFNVGWERDVDAIFLYRFSYPLVLYPRKLYYPTKHVFFLLFFLEKVAFRYYWRGRYRTGILFRGLVILSVMGQGCKLKLPYKNNATKVLSLYPEVAFLVQWEDWMMTWREDWDVAPAPPRGQTELLVRTINLCAGRLVSDDLLSHPHYRRLASRTDTLCRRLRRLPKLIKKVRFLVPLPRQKKNISEEAICRICILYHVHVLYFTFYK